MLLLVVIMVIAAIVKVRDDDLHLALVEAHEFALVKDAALASVHSLELKYKVPVGMELGVDENEYNECVENDTYKDEIIADISAAKSVGISGTPSFVINGKVLVGAQPYEAFAQIIEEELAK